MSAPSHYVAILGSTNKTANVTYLEIGFPSMNRGQGSSSTDSRQSSLPCLRIIARVTLGSSGPVHRCGLKCLNTTFPHPMGCKSGPSADQNAFGRNRYNRGASQQQQPHKSNSSGRVKPLTPLLARKKRKSSLRSVSRFWFIPGVKHAR